MTADGTAFSDVHLLGIPVEVQARAEERHEELLREFVHIANADDEAKIPRRLLALVAEVRARYGALTEPARAQILAARAAGRTEVDVSYRVPREAGPIARTFLDGLEEADEFCRSGDLLTLAAPLELVRFRRWFLGEFLRQLDGEAPRPWQEAAGEPVVEHESR